MLQIESTGTGERVFPSTWSAAAHAQPAGIDEAVLPFSVHVVSTPEQ